MKKNLFKCVMTLFVALSAVCLASCSNDDDEPQLFGTCEISGTVTDIQGNAISGAQVMINRTEVATTPVTATTDADGFYRVTIANATPSLLLQVTAPGYETYSEALTITYINPLPGLTLGEATITVNPTLIPSEL